MKKETVKEIVRWILTILSAILAGLGTEACVKQPDSVQLFQNLMLW